MEFLLGTYAVIQRFIALPYSSYKKRNYGVRNVLVHSHTHRPTQTLSRNLSVIPTVASLPLENGLIYLGSIVGRNRDGLFGADFEREVDCLLANVKSTLEASHSCPDYLLKVTVYFKNDYEFGQNEARINHFLAKYNDIFTSNIPFARTCDFVPSSDHPTETNSSPSPRQSSTTTLPTTTTTTTTTKPLTTVYQNIPRPSLTIVIVQGFFNQACQIQFDGIACTKILADPTISIDSHNAPLFLNEQDELHSYREYMLQKWDNAYDIDALNELELKDKDEHPAVYHAKLQIRLELEKNQKIEMNQRAMVRHTTSKYSGIQRNYPAVHAVTHIPTGYTYISGVTGHLPVKRGLGDDLETQFVQKSDEKLKEDAKVHPTKGPLAQLEAENKTHTSISTSRSKGLVYPPLPYDNSTTPSTSTTGVSYTDPHSVPSPAQQAPLMPESPFTLGFDPFAEVEGLSDDEEEDEQQNNASADSTIPLTIRPDLVEFAKPTNMDLSLIKLIFKDKIHFEVVNYFKHFSFGPHTFEYQISSLLGLQQNIDLYEQLKVVGDMFGGDPSINGDINANVGNNTLTPNTEIPHEDQDDGDYDYQLDNLDDLTSIDPNVINTTKPTTQPSQRHSHPTPTNAQTPETKASSPSTPAVALQTTQIDPQIWLLRHQITLYTFAHVFAQTRQAIYNLIDIAITSNIHLYTGFSKITIYTPSLHYLPLIKYAFQLYWPHHPLNGSPTELFALSIIPVTALPNDALVQFDITAVQHDFNKPFLFKHVFDSPPRFYSGINHVLWHSLFYLLYPDDTPEGQNVSSIPLYLNDTVNRLAKRQYETPSENKESVKRGRTEFANTQRSEYYYNQLLRQAQTREVVTTDRIYTPYYNNPLIVYDKIIEQKQLQNPDYIAAEQRRIAALQSTSPAIYDPFQDDNLQASVMDNGVVEAIINKKELKLSLTELNYKKQHSSAQAITYNIIPLTYDQRVRFYHLTVGCYPRSVVKPAVVRTVANSSLYLHSTWFQSLFTPITSLFTSAAQQQEHEHYLALSDRFRSNGLSDSVVSNLTLTEPVSLRTVSNIPHQSASSNFPLTSLNPWTDPNLDEKWYNYKYDGQYYKPQQQYYETEQLHSLLLKQNQLERDAIKFLLSQMNENELELSTPHGLPQREDGDGIVSLQNVTETGIKMAPVKSSDAKKQRKRKKTKSPSSNRFSNPNVPRLNLDTVDSDDGDDDDQPDPERSVNEADFTTHSLLYSEQYGFPCSALTAVAIEDKLKYCFKYGQNIANSSLNGMVYGSRGVTPGTVYSSAFIGMNYIQLYGSLYKLLRVLKEECTLVKITFIVANSNKNQRVLTKGTDSVQNGSLLDQKTNHKILQLIYNRAQMNFSKASNTATSSPFSSPVPVVPQLTRGNGTTGKKHRPAAQTNLILTPPRQTYDCLQFLRYFQIYLGTRLLFARNPTFQDKSRMFSDFKHKQRPVVTTLVVDSLPNGAKYHLEVIGIYK